MLDIIRDLAPLNRALCSSDYDSAVKYFCEKLPFKVCRFTNDDDHNGWQVPPKWDVSAARILKDGSLIYDGCAHPLGVIALSESFTGSVDLDELKEHLYSDDRYPDALTFYFRPQFRPWSREWGFSVPSALADMLEPGEYDVEIVTEESDGYLDVLVYKHEGTLPDTIMFLANSDHPGVANDGLSGCAVGIELMRLLQGRETKFSYCLVLAQGIIGTEYYLNSLTNAEKASLTEAVCLWMLGSPTQLALQNARYDRGTMQEYIWESIQESGVSARRGSFERIIVNDEYIVEAHGIPTCSLSRFPYPEYHSSLDSYDAIDSDSLYESLNLLIASIEAKEQPTYFIRDFTGAVCLSNPKYDLYISPGQIALGEWPDKAAKELRYLMDFIPSMSRPTTIAEIQSQIDLPTDTIETYLHKWVEKGLIRIV